VQLAKKYTGFSNHVEKKILVLCLLFSVSFFVFQFSVLFFVACDH